MIKVESKEKVFFGDLDCGDTFKMKDSYYIKTHTESAVNLVGKHSGVMIELRLARKVEPIDLIAKVERR